MPRIRQLLLMAFAFVVLAAGREARAVPGCPFCGSTDPPFSQRLAQCDAAVQVKWVSLVSDEVKQTETTTFEVVEVVKNGERVLKQGQKVTLPFGRDGEPGELFLLIGKDDGEALGWELPVQLNGEYLYAYIRQVPSPETPDRLAFFLKFLEFSDAEIAGDAFAEMSRAQYKDVAALAPKLQREKLHKWLSSKDPAMQVRLGLYGMLLGLSGDDSDAKFLESLILTLPDPERPRFGIDGMMAGYILLQRERGLDKLLAAKFDDPLAEDDLLPLRNALVFVWDYARDRVPTETLQAAMRRYLDRPRLAASVLPDLARWKDWSVLERLIQSYGQAPFDADLAKQDIVKFALVCERDGLKQNPDAPPATARKARQFLNGLDPDFVRGVERSLGGLPRPSNSPKSKETSPVP
jgi:hypothetical protein